MRGRQHVLCLTQTVVSCEATSLLSFFRFASLNRKTWGKVRGSYRREVLDAYLFLWLEEVRELTEQWVEEYNTRRPHEALGNLTPSEWPPESKSGNMENSTPASVPAPEVYHITTS